MNKSFIFILMAVILSGCATPNYQPNVYVSPSTYSHLSCKELQAEIRASSSFVQSQINRNYNNVSSYQVNETSAKMNVAVATFKQKNCRKVLGLK